MNKPFLKWAGGKRKSLDMLKEEIGVVKGRFVEPFVGSAVVSLNIEAKEYLLADFNLDLINLYNNLKEFEDVFIKTCKEFFSSKFNSPEKFYELRKKFNDSSDSFERSVLFLYMNRHSFNGLCRYNSKGIFNVPFGKYKRPYFPEEEMILFCEKAQKFEFMHWSFEDTIKKCRRKSDVIYCDPPYVPLSNTSHFTNYSSAGFTSDQQTQLAKLAENSKGLFLISNHYNDFTIKLYKNASKLRLKDVKRYISADIKGRKDVTEVLAIYNNKSLN